MLELLQAQSVGVLIIAAILLLIGIRVFLKPIRLLLRLVINTIGGFVALFFLNMLGGAFGVTLGLNLFNAVVVGIFGLPGVGLLLILQWLLVI